MEHGVRNTHTIFNAVLDSDIATIDKLLKQNCHLMTLTTVEGWTPLHVAVMMSNIQCVSHLLAHRANPDLRDKMDRKPIHLAAHRNVHSSIISKMVSFCKCTTFDHIDCQDCFGRTPLHYVCLDKNTPIVYSGNRIDSNYSTEIINKLHILLNKHYDVNQKDFEGNSPFLLMCKNVHQLSVPENPDRNKLPLEVQLTVNSKSVCGITIEMCMKNGINFDTLNENGMSGLHLACEVHCVEMITLLLPYFTGDTILDKCGNSPMSCILRYSDQCKSFTPSPRNLEWSDLSIHKSIFEDGLRPILKHMKSSVHMQEYVTGCTVLHYAVMETICSSNVLKGLIEYGGANVHVQNYLGKTPLHYASRTTTIAPVTLMDILLKSWQAKVDYLLHRGAKLDSLDMYKNTPLHDAALAGDLNFVKWLIKNGASVNIKNKDGALPFHILCISTADTDSLSSILKCLIEAGTDINCCDLYGSSALHYAAFSNNRDLFQMLVDLGTDMSIKDIEGITAVDFYLNLNHVNVVNTSNLGLDSIDKSIFVNTSNCETYLQPVMIESISKWMDNDHKHLSLSDSKIESLLKSSATTKLSNCLNENIVLKELVSLMKAVFKAVEDQDSRFKINFELSGSTREGTKVESPDEFDLLCILESFNDVCQIEETSPGLVKCRLQSKCDEKYKSLFDDNNLLMGNRLTSSLYICIYKALSQQSVWTFAPRLSLNPDYLPFRADRGLSGVLCLHLKYCDENYKYLGISCDLVPVIRVKGWWPSFARQEGNLITDEIKTNGCMVLTIPSKFDTILLDSSKKLNEFRVSVYLSEYSVLKSLPQSILDSYRLGKLLLKQTDLYPPLSEEIVEDLPLPPSIFHPAQTPSFMFTSYMLKNALLYELDINQLQESNLNRGTSMTRDWTIRIFRRLSKFMEIGIFMPYFMPTKSLCVPQSLSMYTKMTNIFCDMIAALIEAKEY